MIDTLTKSDNRAYFGRGYDLEGSETKEKAKENISARALPWGEEEKQKNIKSEMRNGARNWEKKAKEKKRKKTFRQGLCPVGEEKTEK